MPSNKFFFLLFLRMMNLINLCIKNKDVYIYAYLHILIICFNAQIREQILLEKQ